MTMRLYPDSTQVQKTSTGTGDVQTATPPTNGPPRFCILTVETTSARVTFDGSAPASNNGHVIPAGALPWQCLVAPVIKFASTGGTSSVVNITWVCD